MMRFQTKTILAAAALICLLPAASFAIDGYSQDFEALVQTDPAALTNEGWVVYGNVFDASGNYLYGYGTYDAPNDGLAFCQIDAGQGGEEQGEQQLVIFSDYQNAGHAAGNLIESNTFKEQVIGTLETSETWVFEFQAKLGNIEGSSTAAAFIKTLDPSSGWAMTNFITADMTTIPLDWSGYTISIEIDPSMEGQILQFGFMNTATLYEGSGIFYDNLIFRQGDQTHVPDSSIIAGAQLQQNFPNPFNPHTQINFAMDHTGPVSITVFDLAGRKVATLFQGELEAGDHHVTWAGKTDQGLNAATGQYYYVLATATGQLSRSMILVK
jgi:hypothetical protein